ncbi:MAG: MarR family transcriptional regulator [Clostridiales Family XIII bacterium]|nr:MarR family transcriptional regulator [Clostridiales Family XIII bacterium]
MAILKMQPEIGQKELGYLLDMSKQSLAELLGKLEKSGYITRTQSEQDRRAYIVTLTDKGRKDLSDPAENDEADDGRGIGSGFDCLNDEEQKTFSEYLGRITAELERQLPDGDADDFAFAAQMREQFFANQGFGGRRYDCGEFFGREGFDPRTRDGGSRPHGGGSRRAHWGGGE